MTVLYVPTDELVALAWLKSVPSLAGVPAATTLAAQTSWGTSPTFLQVAIVPLGLPPHTQFPSHGPRIKVSCWAKPKKWGDAGDLSQLVRAATYAPNAARTVTMHVQGYDTARVMAVQALGEPQRIPGDPNQLARFDIPILFEWIPTTSN